MIGRPEPNEADAYYFRYIDRVPGDDVLAVLDPQLEETTAFLSTISEEKSLHRYGPDKWTIRQVLNHVNDCERLFLSRAFWFARGFDSPLPSFDQHTAIAAAGAHEFSWASHVEDFRRIRLATLSFFRNLPAEAWTRRGIASDMPFTVRSLAWIAAGHLAHHVAILKERYL
ncbi:MAG TPA: DinB family protein [Thermoanaerobaculia bacterium]|nr:DinB family protein [Thermoanaerobaculia bacterium]